MSFISCSSSLVPQIHILFIGSVDLVMVLESFSFTQILTSAIL